MSGMPLDEIIKVFKKYMREVGGIPDIKIEMEDTEFAGIPQKRAVVQISDIPNLDTKLIPDGTRICMHDFWAPSEWNYANEYDGQEFLDPPCILICDDKGKTLDSQNPGQTPQVMYKRLRRMLLFKPELTIVNQLNRVNDLLEKLLIK